MNSVESDEDRKFRYRAIETVVRIGIIAALVVYCFRIVRPFIIPVVWGIIIAVAAHPGFLRLRAALGGRKRWRPLCSR